MPGEELHPHSLELAKKRLDSPDPYSRAVAKFALQHGTLPGPDERLELEGQVSATAGQMHDATRAGEHPTTVLNRHMPPPTIRS